MVLTLVVLHFRIRQHAVLRAGELAGDQIGNGRVAECLVEPEAGWPRSAPSASGVTGRGRAGESLLQQRAIFYVTAPPEVVDQ